MTVGVYSVLSVAAKLIRVDCSASSFRPMCLCGWYGPDADSKADADRVADAHRRVKHVQAFKTMQRTRRYRQTVDA